MADLEQRLDAFRRFGVDPFPLASELLTAGRHGEAAEVARAGLARSPDSAEGLCALGRALHAMGQVDAAQAALVKAARIERENPRVLAALAEVVLPRDGAKGRALLAHALRFGPTDAQVLAARDRIEGRAPAVPASPAPPPLRARSTQEPAQAAAPSPPRPPPLRPPPLAPPKPPARSPLAFRPPPPTREDDTEDEITSQKSTPPPPLPPVPSAPTAAAPERPSGGAAPGPDDPESVLAALVAAGVLDVEDGAGEAKPWQRPAASRGGGIVWWIGLWVILAGVIGGFVYKRIREVQARERASTEALALSRSALVKGDPPSLRAASRRLRFARTLDARNGEVAAELGLVEAWRLLETGEGGIGEARAAIARADALRVKTTSLAAAKAALALAGVEPEVALRALEPAVRRTPNDARVKYLQASLADRLGDAGAAARYDQALGATPPLAAIRLALAAIYVEAGDAERARAVSSQLADVPTGAAIAARALVEATFGEPAGAAALARQALEKPRDLGPNARTLARVALARALRRSGDALGARGATEGAIKEACVDPRTWRLLAEESLAVGEPARAEQAAVRAVAFAPLAADGRRVLARVYLARRQANRAIETLATVPEGDRGATILRARALLLDGKASDAAGLVSPISQANAADLEAKLLGLRARAHAGEASAVRREAEALEREKNDDPTVLEAVADVLLEADDGRAALRRIVKALGIRPGDPELLLLRGRALRATGDLDGAVASLLEAHGAQPDLVEALSLAGDLQLDRGKYAEARQIFDRAAGLPRGRTPGRLGAAEAAVAVGDLDGATALVDEVAHGQGSARIRTIRARIALGRGEAREAVALLDPLIAGPTKTAPVLALRGAAKLRAGDRAGAKADFQEALSMDDGLPEALLGLGDVLLADGEEPDAKDQAEEALSSLGRRIRPAALRAHAHVILARVAFAKGAPGKNAASAELARALEADPSHPDTHYFLGLLRARSNDAAGARAALARYLELAPNGGWADDARRRGGVR